MEVVHFIKFLIDGINLITLHIYGFIIVQQNISTSIRDNQIIISIISW